MNPDQKKNKSPENSESNEQDSGSNEEKSEEFLNFESGLKAILGLTKEQIEEVKKKSPYPKKDRGS